MFYIIIIILLYYYYITMHRDWSVVYNMNALQAPADLRGTLQTQVTLCCIISTR